MSIVKDGARYVGDSVVESPVKVYDQEGRVVGVDTLKKYDLLVVYWKAPRSFNESITQNIQGTLCHSSLAVFGQLDLRNEGFLGENSPLVSAYSNLFRWRDIDKIHFAGNDPTGRTISFVRELNCQRDLAERNLQETYNNIDNLKAGQRRG